MRSKVCVPMTSGAVYPDTAQPLKVMIASGTVVVVVLVCVVLVVVLPVIVMVVVVVELVVVDVAPPPHVMATKLPPVTSTMLLTQVFSMPVWMPDAFPSPVHPLTLLKAVVNFPVVFEMHPESTGIPFAAAFEMQPSSPEASLPAAFSRDASHLLGLEPLPSGSTARIVD